MERRVFDPDGHLIEPTDLYFDRLDPAFRDRVQVDRSLGERHGRHLHRPQAQSSTMRQPQPGSGSRGSLTHALKSGSPNSSV
jgi:hypothetical protein